MFKRKKIKEEIKEEVITLAMKEEEIKQAYSNIQVEKNNVSKDIAKKEKKEKEKKEKKKKEKVKIKKKRSLKKLLFLIPLILLLFIAIDIISVSKFDKGPFFAIPTKKQSDGTKKYYGLGYKVTKYSKKIGKKQRKIELWNLKIQKKVSIKDKDLLKELMKDETKTYNKYKNKSMKIDSTLSEIDPESHKITAKYTDEENNRDLRIICTMNNQKAFNRLQAEKDIKILGNITKIKTKIKDEKSKTNIYIKNCSTKQ